LAELRKFKLKQACPLCRTPLPPGPDELFEEATLRCMLVKRRVKRGDASWGALIKDEQRGIQAVVGGLRAAADQGRAEAHYNLGNMFAQGHGVAQSDVEATRWFRKAAGQGIAKAQHELENMFDEGRGVPQSDVEAARWCRKAADQGIAQAQNNLGIMFDKGRGVAPNDVEAARRCRKAADQGIAHVANHLRP
jgi:TPR repeat protein